MFFDPDAALVKAGLTKSGAFDATEKPIGLKSSAGTMSSLRKIVAGGSAISSGGGSGNGEDSVVVQVVKARSSTSSDWSKNFIRIAGNKLTCYDRQQDYEAHQDPKLVLVIDDMTIIEDKPEEVDHKSEACCYEVVTGSGSVLKLTSDKVISDIITNAVKESVRWAKMGASGNGR
jgi:hypothetical protein